MIWVEITQIVCVGIMGTMLTVTLKKYSPEISLAAALVTGVIIVIAVIGQALPVIEVIKRISDISGIDNKYIEIVLKVIAISYISEFGSALCADAGVGAVASKIELAGKVIVMGISAPIVLEFLETVMKIV